MKKIKMYVAVIFILIQMIGLDIYALGSNEITGASALVMDKITGRVLFEKNGYEKRAMASTTKIMTCIIALENCQDKQKCIVSKKAAKAPIVKLHVKENEAYYLNDLLYALMLESSNDVAVVIAEAIGGDVDHFCQMMTNKAREIGAENTSFKTPNGLDADGHYTTAYDMALITKYALENETFLKIINTSSHQFNEIENGRGFQVNNKNAFLKMYEGAMGVKTGFTNKAGYCFVGYMKDGEEELISVVFASGWPPNKTYRWADTKIMMDYGFENYDHEELFDENIKVKIGNIGFGIVDQVEGQLFPKDLVCLSEEESVRKIIKLKHIENAPVSKGEVLGEVKVYIDDDLYRRYEITAQNEVEHIDFKYCLNKVLKLFLIRG